MRALCEKHNLAVAADGKCVVCRRPLGGALGFQPEPVESVLSKVVTVLLLVGLAAAMGALGYLSTLPEPYSGPKRIAALPPDEDTSLATIREPVQAAERDGGTAVAAVAGDASTAAPLEPSAQAAAEAEDESEATTKRESASEQRARYAARASVPVTLFTAEWCVLCNQARDYLLVRGVAVQSLDIDTDKAAFERMTALNKAATLPTFEIAGKPVVGFNPTELEATIDAAAAKSATAKSATAKTAKASNTTTAKTERATPPAPARKRP